MLSILPTSSTLSVALSPKAAVRGRSPKGTALSTNSKRIRLSPRRTQVKNTTGIPL